MIPFWLLSALDVLWLFFRSRLPGGTKKQSKSARIWVLGQLFALGILIVGPFLWGFFPRPPWLFLGGISLSFSGFAFIAWSMATLGRHWAITLAVDKDHYLVTQGPYSLFRHPLYFGLFLMGVGTACAWSSLWSLFPGLGLLALTNQCRANLEEKHLAQRHGPAWKEYRRNTWSWFPFLR